MLPSPVAISERHMDCRNFWHLLRYAISSTVNHAEINYSIINESFWLWGWRWCVFPSKTRFFFALIATCVWYRREWYIDGKLWFYLWTESQFNQLLSCGIWWSPWDDDLLCSCSFQNLLGWKCVSSLYSIQGAVILRISHIGVHKAYCDTFALFSSTKFLIYDKEKGEQVKVIILYKYTMDLDIFLFEPTDPKIGYSWVGHDQVMYMYVHVVAQ